MCNLSRANKLSASLVEQFCYAIFISQGYEKLNGKHCMSSIWTMWKLSKRILDSVGSKFRIQSYFVYDIVFIFQSSNSRPRWNLRCLHFQQIRVEPSFRMNVYMHSMSEVSGQSITHDIFMIIKIHGILFPISIPYDIL